MEYVSTRGGMAPAGFADILIEGLAPDGGLCVPVDYPSIGAADLARWRDLAYPDLAREVIGLFADDLPELPAIVKRTYTADVFGSADIVPLEPLDGDLLLLRLSNGPTLAFKDIAMQFLGHAFEHVLGQEGQTLNILGATSGDTGSAAEYAMASKHGVRVVMLSPLGKMTPFQTAQMFSLQDANIVNLAVRGVFDDCQDIVKQIAGDVDFKRRHRLGAVNSINWGRIVAQVVYYVHGWLRATAIGAERVSFAVPSGNFGNILAGHVARSMGVPIHRLILATNENDVLHEFFATGTYRVRPGADVAATSSPSMDISKASNFERFVFDAVGRDPERTLELFSRMDRERAFALDRDAVAGFGFASGSSRHADRIATIRDLHARTGRIIDPHTADGVKVARDLIERGETVICLETALPVKFAATIVEALGVEPGRPERFVGLEEAPMRFEVIDPDPEIVRERIAQV
jgi:threonine synthase